MAGYNLKSAEEVKDYLANLYTEYKFGCYSEGNPEVCHNLGEYMFSIKADIPAALDIFRKNCDTFNFAKSCTKFGTYSAIGKGCEQNYALGYEYLKKACKQNDSSGCANAGLIGVSRSEVHQKDRLAVVQEGTKLLHKACEELNVERACFALTEMYRKGIENILERDGLRAYKLAVRSCELGNPLRCLHVSEMLTSGKMVEKDLQLAEAYKKKAHETYKERVNPNVSY